MQSENGRLAAVAAWGASVSGPSTGTFFVQPYTTTATIPQKRKPEIQDPNADSIDCICGFTYDDGSLSIACDECERWCHAACFGIVEGKVPEEWRCWECFPQPIFKERAVGIQRERQRQIQEMLSRSSPGVEKKPRRTSAAAIDGSKRKRRPSILTQNHIQPPTQRTEDEHVEICEPWTLGYVPIAQDIIPHKEAREKLERAAHSWRGVTVLQSSEQDLHPPRTTVQPLPTSSFSHPTLSLCTNPSVRPPSYAVHTAEPIPRSRMIAPYHSTIIPSSTYLSDTLNTYAYLGLPKPFVHLVGPPLDLALDSRITGDSTRFVRSGCKPNAVLRPMVCPKSKDKGQDRGGGESEQPKDTIGFGVFALRDLKANEEVVLGWEWDDGHAVHNLPALIESPHSFQRHHVAHLRNQMTSMLNSFSSTFTTCACGAKANDCALNLMAAFVDGELPSKPEPEHIDLGPLVGSSRGFKTRERVPFSGGMTGVEMVPDHSGDEINHAPNMNGDVETQVNGCHGSHEGRVFSASELASSPIGASSESRAGGKKGKDKATVSEDHDRTTDWEASPGGLDRQGYSQRRKVATNSVPVSDTIEEDKMPPKMRKRWIHHSSKALLTTQRHDATQDEGVTEDEVMEVYPDSTKMPPPPLPPHRRPTNGSTTPSSALSSMSSSSSITDLLVSPLDQDISPSSCFANLSLLSPIFDHSRSFPPRESFPFKFPNQSSLLHKFSLENQDTTPTLAFRSVPPSSSLDITEPPPPPKLDESAPPPTDVVNPPSPLRLLSPIDSNVSHPKSGHVVQQVSLDSPQMLLSLPQFERHKSDKTVNERSTDPKPLWSQPLQAPPPLDSPQRAQSSPVTSYLPPSVSPVLQAESLPPQQLSPPSQKVKTSFKDFLMRKKKQREEPIASPTMTNLETDSSCACIANCADHIGEGSSCNFDRIAGERHSVPPTDRPNSGILPSPSANGLSLGDPQIEDAFRDSRSASVDEQSDCGDTSTLSDSWILDPKLSPAGLIVQVKDEWHKRDMAGVKGVVKAVVRQEGVTPLIILKPLRGNSHDGVPVVYTIPVIPSQTGDILTIIGGKLKGETGSIVEVREGGFLLQLDTTESVVEVRESWTCMRSKDGDGGAGESSPEDDGEVFQVTVSPPPPSSGASSTRQSCTPSITPTQPRSFPTYPSSLSKPGVRFTPPSVPPSRPRQVSPPSQSRPPSGPKALRVGGPKNTYTQSHSSYPPKRSFGTNPNSSLGLPRGPSADRDREWTGSNWPSRNRAPPGAWR